MIRRGLRNYRVARRFMSSEAVQLFSAADVQQAKKVLLDLEDKVLIGKEWRRLDSEYLVNPVTGEKSLKYPVCTTSEVQDAATFALSSFPSWSTLSHDKRADWLDKLADVLEKNKITAALIESMNCGKPIREAMGDITDACTALRYSATLARKLDTMLPQPESTDLGDGNYGKIEYSPIGVVGAICPFNFPLLMASWKLGPALAAGCPILLKPSEYTPLSLMYLSHLAHSIDFPEGVLTVVPGSGSLGALISSIPEVAKVTFTGSVDTGRKVMKSAADLMKPVTLELGGKSPAIVFPDVDLDDVCEWLVFGIAFNAGQVCSATTRLLLHKDIADALVKKLKDAFEAIKLGAPLASDTECGPVVSEAQYRKVKQFIEVGIQEGNTLITGGPQAPPGLPSDLRNGFFVSPTLFGDVTPEHTLFREEVFGPVGTITTFSTESEAIALANDSRYGLAASVFTNDTDLASRVSRALDAGVVWINSSQPAPCTMPWGGTKLSGIGSEMGPHALLPYLQPKSVIRSNVAEKLNWYRHKPK